MIFNKNAKILNKISKRLLLNLKYTKSLVFLGYIRTKEIYSLSCYFVFSTKIKLIRSIGTCNSPILTEMARSSKILERTFIVILGVPPL